MASATPDTPLTTDGAPPLARKRVRPWDAAFYAFVLGATLIALGSLLWLFGVVLWQGIPGLSREFLTNDPSRLNADTAGFYSPMVGSIVLMFWTALVAIPVGFAGAVYLEKFAPTSKKELYSWRLAIERRAANADVSGFRVVLLRARVLWARLWSRIGPRTNRILEVNISNLAAVPSIVYGLLGLALFVEIMSFSKSLFTGGITLGLLVLPIIIVASREAVRAVPISIEHGAMALGATRWQAVLRQVLPAALPGMLTGTILAMSRAIGETAPLVVMGAVLFATDRASFNPAESLDGTLWAMPLQIFFWKFDAQTKFHDLAAAGIIILLVVLILMNLTAILIRNRFSRRW